MDWEELAKKRNSQKNFENNIKDFFDGHSILPIIAIGLIFFIGVTSFYSIKPDEQGVITRLGKFVKISGPGAHFKVPFGIDQVTKIKTTIVHEETFGIAGSSLKGRRGKALASLKDESLMLTGDLNVLDVQWVVQYRISDPKNYLFKVRDPIKNLRDISQATMRRVVGDRAINEFFEPDGRLTVANLAKELTQDILNKYEIGLEIRDVQLQSVNPPESVIPSFNDVNAAKQEQEKAINDAEKQYNNVIPEAIGKAQELISQSEGYAVGLVNRSKGDAERFKQVLKEYKKAPVLTKKRLYLETVQNVLWKNKNLKFVDPDLKTLIPILGEQNIGARR
ncbi:UNVERIFIED_CONTAM: hypothetical protein GTU68_022542 [Idotea baltica]|nr:hypothetical protein [Idotea baltica]